MYNICISIICVQFLRGTGHLVEKEKTSHYVQGGHTDYCWKSTRKRGAGAYCRSETGGVGGTNRPARRTSIGHCLHFFVYNDAHSSSISVCGTWSDRCPQSPLFSNRMYKAVFHCCLWSPLWDQVPSTVKGLKDALDHVFWHHLVWAPAEAPLVKIPATQRRCIGA